MSSVPVADADTLDTGLTRLDTVYPRAGVRFLGNRDPYGGRLRPAVA